MRYKCPSCGFSVFNRRVANCESCHAPLPAEFLYSKEQVEAIDAEIERNKKKAANFKRSMGVSGGGDGGGAYFDSGGGSGCDGGGGGDCG